MAAGLKPLHLPRAHLGFRNPRKKERKKKTIKRSGFTQRVCHSMINRRATVKDSPLGPGHMRVIGCSPPTQASDKDGNSLPKKVRKKEIRLQADTGTIKLGIILLFLFISRIRNEKTITRGARPVTDCSNRWSDRPGVVSGPGPRKTLPVIFL